MVRIHSRRDTEGSKGDPGQQDRRGGRERRHVVGRQADPDHAWRGGNAFKNSQAEVNKKEKNTQDSELKELKVNKNHK